MAHVQQHHGVSFYKKDVFLILIYKRFWTVNFFLFFGVEILFPEQEVLLGNLNRVCAKSRCSVFRQETVLWRCKVDPRGSPYFLQLSKTIIRYRRHKLLSCCSPSGVFFFISCSIYLLSFFFFLRISIRGCVSPSVRPSVGCSRVIFKWRKMPLLMLTSKLTKAWKKSKWILWRHQNVKKDK